MARKTNEEKERTYNQLLEASIILFTEQGFAGTTLTQISEKAGYTRGAFYWHFRDKNDVLKAIWQKEITPIILNFAKKMADDPDICPIVRLQGQICKFVKNFNESNRLKAIAKVISQCADLTKVNRDLTHFFNSQKNLILEILRTVFHQIQNTGKLRQDTDLETIVSGFFCLLNGILLQSAHPNSPDNLLLQAIEIIDMYLEGVMEVSL